VLRKFCGAAFEPLFLLRLGVSRINPCERNVGYFELELNFNYASAANPAFEMHKNEANMVASMRGQMWPMRE
jgi:hypothetical protein